MIQSMAHIEENEQRQVVEFFRMEEYNYMILYVGKLPPGRLSTDKHMGLYTYNPENYMCGFYCNASHKRMLLAETLH